VELGALGSRIGREEGRGWGRQDGAGGDLPARGGAAAPERITSGKWGLGYFVEFWPWSSADVDIHPTAQSELDCKTGLLVAIHVFRFFCLYIG
jgi:hypothetical protein